MLVNSSLMTNISEITRCTRAVKCDAPRTRRLVMSVILCSLQRRQVSCSSYSLHKIQGVVRKHLTRLGEPLMYSYTQLKLFLYIVHVETGTLIVPWDQFICPQVSCSFDHRFITVPKLSVLSSQIFICLWC